MVPSILLLSSLVLLVFGFGLIAVAGMLFRPGESSVQRFARLALKILGTLLNVVALVAMIASVIGIFFAVVAAAILAMAMVKRRAGQRYALLATLAIAAERWMPLAAAIEAFAQETGGSLGRSARQAAEMLRAGHSLPDVLEQVGGLVPRDALAAVRLGAESGSLAAALRETAQSQQSFEPIWSQISGGFLYFSVILAIMMNVSAFMVLKIAPEFEKIFTDFDAELPALTQSVLTAARFSAAYWFLVVVPVQLAVLGLMVYALARFVGWSGFDLPGIGGLTRRFHSAPILHALALVVERGLPFRGGLATLAGSYPASSIRWRLHAVLLDVDGGADWADRLAAYGLIRKADRAVLQAAQRVGNLPWALREMAASSRRRLVYRLNGLVQLFFVMLILTFGVLVLWLVAGFFLPLVDLIQKLA